MDTEGKVIDITEAKRANGMKVLYKDYEGRWVGVSSLIVRNPKVRARVKDLLENGVDVRLVYTGDEKPEYVGETMVEFFGRDLEICTTIDNRMAEYWGMNTVQFNGHGERVDGLDVNGCVVNIQILDTENGPEVLVPNPVFQTANEQIVSMGMYLGQSIRQAMEVMMNAGDEALGMAQDSINKMTVEVDPKVELRKESKATFFVLQLTAPGQPGDWFVADFRPEAETKVIVTGNLDDAKQFDAVIEAHDFRKAIIDGGGIEEEHADKLEVRDKHY